MAFPLNEKWIKDPIEKKRSLLWGFYMHVVILVWLMKGASFSSL